MALNRIEPPTAVNDAEARALAARASELADWLMDQPKVKQCGLQLLLTVRDPNTERQLSAIVPDANLLRLFVTDPVRGIAEGMALSVMMHGAALANIVAEMRPEIQEKTIDGIIASLRRSRTLPRGGRWPKA